MFGLTLKRNAVKDTKISQVRLHYALFRHWYMLGIVIKGKRCQRGAAELNVFFKFIYILFPCDHIETHNALCENSVQRLER